MKPKFLTACVLICALFTACKEDKKRSEAEQIVKEWMGKTIKFPSGVPCSYLGKDTICPDIEAKPYKILAYIDSIGCTSCKLKMYEWKNIMDNAEISVSGNVSFHFYIHPKDKNELTFLLRRDNFNYPVYFDERNKINQLNDFPSNMAYQCFLLDKENKVIAIGNPSTNPNVWELYKNIIAGKPGTDTNEKSLITEVEIINQVIEIENLKANKTNEAVFVLKNTGNQPLSIKNVNASCGCTVPSWEKQPVKPGSETHIKVEVKPDNEGYFHKKITVFCNVEDGYIPLTVKGVAK